MTDLNLNSIHFTLTLPNVGELLKFWPYVDLNDHSSNKWPSIMTDLNLNSIYFTLTLPNVDELLKFWHYVI